MTEKAAGTPEQLWVKRPMPIRARQWFAEQLPSHPGVWCDQEGADAGKPYVITIHNQRVYLAEGDWVVPEPDGEHYYPIKADIFADNYRPLPSGAAPTVTDQTHVGPSCTKCGAAMVVKEYKCLSCGNISGCKDDRIARSKRTNTMIAEAQAEVERLRKELVYEKERADGNFKSCERIKGNFSDTVNELKAARASEKALQVELEKADKDIETWRNNFQMLSVKASALRASEKAPREALDEAYIIIKGLHVGTKWEIAPDIKSLMQKWIMSFESALAAAQANQK